MDEQALEAIIKAAMDAKELRIFRTRGLRPRWTGRLRRLLHRLPATPAASRGPLSGRLVAPALLYARDEVARRLRRSHCDSLSPRALGCLENELAKKLRHIATPALRLHRRAFTTACRSLFAVRGHLSRAEIERAFLGHDVRQRLAVLFQLFPSLARLWAEVIADWVGQVHELATRLRKDRRAIASTFFSGRELGELRAVRAGISDPHRGGRETMVLQFEAGCVVYKPRSGRSEAAWFGFLRWANEQRFQPAFRELRILRRRTYCWMEYIEPAPCQTLAEARQYYRRAGGLLCVASLFDAVDLHCDNLIAARDQPVLIDAETLFHPGAKGECPILRTGLVPAPGLVDGSGRSISALGGTEGKHTPSFKSEPLRPAKYLPELMEGFAAMWAIAGRAGSSTPAALRRRLRKLARARWRRIYLPTARYVAIREQSISPSLLRSGTARAEGLAQLLRRPGVSRRILAEEILALTRFDVPVFAARSLRAPGGLTNLQLADLVDRIARAFAGPRP